MTSETLEFSFPKGSHYYYVIPECGSRRKNDKNYHAGNTHQVDVKRKIIQLGQQKFEYYQGHHLRS